MTNVLEHDSEPGGTPITIEWGIGCDRCGTIVETRTAETHVVAGSVLKMTHIIACRVCDQQIDDILQSLLKYGRHAIDCSLFRERGLAIVTCSCGWGPLNTLLRKTANPAESVKSET